MYRADFRSWFSYFMFAAVVFTFLILLILYQKSLAEIGANIMVTFDKMERDLYKSRHQNAELLNANIYQGNVKKCSLYLIPMDLVSD